MFELQRIDRGRWDNKSDLEPDPPLAQREMLFALTRRGQRGTEKRAQ
jgi:hypothetical protein